MILEYRATGSFAGNYLTLIIINIAFSLAVPNISIGGHLGGLVGGILGTLAILYIGKPYRRIDYVGFACLFAIAVASIAIGYWKARGLA